MRLTAVGTQIQTVGAYNLPTGTQNISDGDYFAINDGFTTVVFEFDNDGRYTANRVPVTFGVLDSAATIAQEVVTAIQTAVTAKGLKLGVSYPGAGSLITLTGSVVRFTGFATTQGRPHARLAIDPGVVVKLVGSRVETQVGAQFIAEGTPANPIIFSSVEDDRYGAGGTFDTTNDQRRTSPAAGDWASLDFGPLSQASIDWARVFYAGGRSSIEGDYVGFDPIEIRQASARIANTLFEDNGAVPARTNDRNGRGFADPATIFVRGAQPVIVANTFRANRARSSTSTSTP